MISRATLKLAWLGHTYMEKKVSLVELWCPAFRNHGPVHFLLYTVSNILIDQAPQNDATSLITYTTHSDTSIII